MIKSSMEFYESLPEKCCTHCGEPLEELADCYSSICHPCQGVTFYALTPISEEDNKNATLQK